MCHSPVLEIFPPDWPYIHVNIEYKSIETCKKKKKDLELDFKI